MYTLLDFLQDGDAEAIERALCEDEVVIICDDQEDPEMIVQDFAESVRGLSYRATPDHDLEITFQGRTLKAGLRREPSDGDRTRWAIRDVLLPDYETRVLRSCLGTDTLAFVVETPAIWQQAEAKAPGYIAELFTPFTDEIGFEIGG